MYTSQQFPLLISRLLDNTAHHSSSPTSTACLCYNSQTPAASLCTVINTQHSTTPHSATTAVPKQRQRQHYRLNSRQRSPLPREIHSTPPQSTFNAQDGALVLTDVPSTRSVHHPPLSLPNYSPLPHLQHTSDPPSSPLQHHPSTPSHSATPVPAPRHHAPSSNAHSKSPHSRPGLSDASSRRSPAHLSTNNPTIADDSHLQSAVLDLTNVVKCNHKQSAQMFTKLRQELTTSLAKIFAADEFFRGNSGGSSKHSEPGSYLCLIDYWPKSRDYIIMKIMEAKF